ncbi:MAG: hypothetical protein NTX97_04035 [Bacteroidetes bacterium]|nr:hypothetical protein [Bacteroidota bacterium]
MKKLFSLIIVAGALSIVSCGGPSKEDAEKAAALVKAQMDSVEKIAAAGLSSAMKDSTATKDSVVATPAK